MIRKIILHNFMAHSHSEIALVEGVTVLTGPNNTGKSAVVEGLRCLSENPSLGKAFIRHGARQATVAVELEDGTVLRWHRKKNTAWYEIERAGQEPESFYKMGQGKAPPQVLELLKIQPVAIDDKNTVDVHLGDQRSPVFLIDRPAAQVAHFFAASSEGAHLLTMQDLLKTKVRDARKERQALQLRQEEERGLLDRLAALPHIALTLETAESEATALAALAESLPWLTRCLEQLRLLRDRRAQLTARRLALAPLADPPALEAVDRLARMLDRRAALVVALAQTTLRRDALAPASPPPALEPVRQLARGLEARRTLLTRAERLQHRAEALLPLADPPGLLEVRRLDGLLRRQGDCARRIERLQARGKAVATLHSPPELAATARPAALCLRWRELQIQQTAAARRVETLSQAAEPPALLPAAPLAGLLAMQYRLLHLREQAQRRVEAATSALARQQEAVAARLEALGHCPTCGQALSRASAREFLEGGHGH